MSSLGPASRGWVTMMAKIAGKLATNQSYMAIFELGVPSDGRMRPRKFHEDICNGSGVIALTDRQTRDKVRKWPYRID